MMTIERAELDYAERSALAATHQGLDPVSDELWRCGIDHDVTNMGGWCMAVTVRRGEHVAVVTTWDSPDGIGVVGVYDFDEWMDGGEPLKIRDDVLLVDVVEVVVAYLDEAAR